jgi:hypothetical protein
MDYLNFVFLDAILEGIDDLLVSYTPDWVFISFKTNDSEQMLFQPLWNYKLSLTYFIVVFDRPLTEKLEFIFYSETSVKYFIIFTGTDNVFISKWRRFLSPISI